MRLVSLLPSATEIVYALGLGDQLAGVTFECDEPASARAEKTIVVGGLDTGGMTPRKIDDYVRGRLAAGGDLYTLHERAQTRHKSCVKIRSGCSPASARSCSVYRSPPAASRPRT